MTPMEELLREANDIELGTCESVQVGQKSAEVLAWYMSNQDKRKDNTVERKRG